MSPGQGIYASSSRAVDRFGRLDALVSNAGVATVAPLADGSLADWDRMIDVNLRAVMHGIAAALPVFTVAGFWALRHHHLHRGHKIGLRTRGVRRPVKRAYAASKAGVRALCEVLRQETGPEIRATMVCPEATATEFVSDPQSREQIAAIAMAPDAVAEAIAYALEQPKSVNVGEIVVRSAAQP